MLFVLKVYRKNSCCSCLKRLFQLASVDDGYLLAVDADGAFLLHVGEDAEERELLNAE